MVHGCQHQQHLKVSHKPPVTSCSLEPSGLGVTQVGLPVSFSPCIRVDTLTQIQPTWSGPLPKAAVSFQPKALWFSRDCATTQKRPVGKAGRKQVYRYILKITDTIALNWGHRERCPSLSLASLVAPNLGPGMIPVPGVSETDQILPIDTTI